MSGGGNEHHFILGMNKKVDPRRLSHNLHTMWQVTGPGHPFQILSKSQERTKCKVFDVVYIVPVIMYCVI